MIEQYQSYSTVLCSFRKQSWRNFCSEISLTLTLFHKTCESSFLSGAHLPAAPLVCSAVFGVSACHSSPLAPIGTLAMPSCQWVLIIEDWPDCMAAGNRITYGTSGASNQLLSARGNGDLIKSMVHRCCYACTPHDHAEMWSCT